MIDTTILLRYSPALGQLVDAEGKGIGVVCVPNVATQDMAAAGAEGELNCLRHWADERATGIYAAMLAAARPDLRAATVTKPERMKWPKGATPVDDARVNGFNAALDAIK